LRWIHTLPEPKNSQAVLAALRKLPPVEQVTTLASLSPEIVPIIHPVVERTAWDQEDFERLRRYYEEDHHKKVSQKHLENKLNGWADVKSKSSGFLGALQAYYDVFFAEDERRIQPALEEALANAQNKSTRQTVHELLVDLSQGVHFAREDLAEVQKLVLAPSFWASPFIFFDMGPESIMLFGARPADASLIPGEVVSDALLKTLSALSDPTRLRILRYLAAETLTPTQLAARLRLRTPTVAHHLKTIRAAGLVYVIQSPGKEVYYKIRLEGFEGALQQLRQFIFEKEHPIEIDKGE